MADLEPYFVPESEGLIETWASKVRVYLAGLDADVDKVSSRSIKKTLKADKVSPIIIAVANLNHPTCYISTLQRQSGILRSVARA